MSFRRTFAPAIVNSSNVKGLHNSHSEQLVDGTVKSNRCAEGDFHFWIPLAAPLLREFVYKRLLTNYLLNLELMLSFASLCCNSRPPVTVNIFQIRITIRSTLFVYFNSNKARYRYE